MFSQYDNSLWIWALQPERAKYRSVSCPGLFLVIKHDARVKLWQSFPWTACVRDKDSDFLGESDEESEKNKSKRGEKKTAVTVAEATKFRLFVHFGTTYMAARPCDYCKKMRSRPGLLLWTVFQLWSREGLCWWCRFIDLANSEKLIDELSWWAWDQITGIGGKIFFTRRPAVF